MPYLQYLYCDTCEHPHNLDLDFQGTLEAYKKDGRISPQINSATLVWDYMVYSCSTCRQKFKFTFRDIEQRVRKYLSSLGMQYNKYLDELDEYNNTEEARKSGDFFKNKDREVKERISKLYVES